jgi:hypothetical protein
MSSKPADVEVECGDSTGGVLDNDFRFANQNEVERAVARPGILLGADKVMCDVMDALNPVVLWVRPANAN